VAAGEPHSQPQYQTVLNLNKSQLVQGRYDLVVLVCRMVFSSLLGSRNGRKVVVSSGNSKRKHISNFLSTPYKHDMPKLVLLHLYFIYMTMQNCHTSQT